MEAILSAPTSPWDWRTRLWWLLWSRCPGVGPHRIATLLKEFGSLETAWCASAPMLADRCRWSDRLLAGIEAYRLQWGQDPLQEAAMQWRHGRGVLLPGDRRWPDGMRRTTPPPAALYWSGRGSLWRLLSERRAVAVVGTRRPSRHGLSVSRDIGAVLAQGGWPVVSGLAAGIDGAAHQGCLMEHGAPIGVLGTPLQRVYPLHHASLQASVEHHGLLMTELPPGAPVCKASFALRNRLQVALACAVILVECPMGSGALQSAELAWQEGLPLWVVPADTGRTSAEGSNGLLARGATPLTRPEDLMKLLGPGPLCRRPLVDLPSPGPDTDFAGESLAGQLVSIVGRGASMEELCSALQLTSQELLPLLLDLEASGVLTVEPGLFWRPC